MKRIEDKFKRTIKYWRVSYRQASDKDRLSMGLFAFALAMLVYAWWMLLAS
jgi:hypothetical protein